MQVALLHLVPDLKKPRQEAQNTKLGSSWLFSCFCRESKLGISLAHTWTSPEAEHGEQGIVR